MSSLERHVTDQASYDEAWDRMDNRGDMSPDDIRRELSTTPFGETLSEGVEPEVVKASLHRPGRAMGTTAILSPGERRARQAAAHGPQYGEEARVGFDDGVLPEERPVAEVLALINDPVQQATNRKGSAGVRAEMGWPPKDKGE